MKLVLCSLLAALFLTTARPVQAAAPVTLVQDGVPKSVISVDPAVMQPDARWGKDVTAEDQAKEVNRRKLRDSVTDLSLYLGKISGAKVEILTTPIPAGDARLPLLVGDVAQKVFGAPGKKAPAAQGFRLVISPKGVGFIGESDEAVSYAIYELLDRLGCRWILPSEMGEYVPSEKTIALQPLDFSSAPATIYRGIWYADGDFKRRNRLGGFPIQAGHALEVKAGDRYGYLTVKQLEEHPDWNAMINGKRSVNGRFCWANHEVSDAVADSVIAKLDEHYVPSISLSPQDGATFCECPLCKALDAGDYDPVMDTPSITDRYINFCNRIATKVAKKYPDVKLGFLAYVQYTQAPVREKLHPSLVPQLAPINYCRAHDFNNPACPSRQMIRKILEGWAKATNSISYYNYMFNLAEYSAPYPMIRQMSEELPVIYKNHVDYWQPEGMSDYEAILPGHYLSLRLAWNPDQKPQDVLDEFYTKFYGNAASTMRTYWTMWDDQWNKVDEHSGSGFGYWRRFTPEFMTSARSAMDAALASCKTPMEYRRVEMQNLALDQFERFMQLRWDLNEGRLLKLGPESKKWMASQLHLGDQYAAQYAFDKIPWDPDTAAGRWFRLFFQPSYLDASRISKDFRLASAPLRQWKYAVDKEKAGEAANWQNADFADAAWKTTDVGVETWATLGTDNYFGPMWYRSKQKLTRVLPNKKTYLWVSSADGDVKVWINGQAVPYLNAKGESAEQATGTYCQPLSFDISAAVKPGAENSLVIKGTRVFINELGTGGLLGPVYIYQEK